VPGYQLVQRGAVHTLLERAAHFLFELTEAGVEFGPVTRPGPFVDLVAAV
jgi:hypothetical protein